MFDEKGFEDSTKVEWVEESFPIVKEITVRMPQPLLDKWLAALRSGEFKQGVGMLCNHEPWVGNSYCCLGVLQMVQSGRTETGGVPSADWLWRNGIKFSNKTNPKYGLYPWLPILKTDAINANDGGVSFSRIADALEACSEGF